MSEVQHQRLNMGFTVIELIVVLAIMTMIVGLVIIDFAGQRPERDLRIAQNELVTNIRKAQSYSLFSRNVNSVKPAQYYVLKFSVTTPDRYFIQAITDSSSAPVLHDLETVLLPKNIIMSASNSFVITRPTPIIPSPDPATCALLAFKSPFAKIYANNGCNTTTPAFQAGDDYKKILDHINNVNGSTVSSEANLLITLAFKNGGQTKKVLVKGITGLVCPTIDGTTCSF